MLPALNSLSEQGTQPTTKTMVIIDQFLDYTTINLDVAIEYNASDMHLWIDSDAAYLVAPKERSRAVVYFYLSKTPKDPIQSLRLNAPIQVECKLLRFIQTSST